MGVLLIDLDDTLVPDLGARDAAMRSTHGAFGARADLPQVWALVRGAWRASGLRSLPALAGVSSWEALWTDFAKALPDPSAAADGRAFQLGVWRNVFPGVDPGEIASAFCGAREALVRPCEWVLEALSRWSEEHRLWCVTNGSSWMQRRKLELAGLAGWFEQVVVSGEVGAVKADPPFHQEVRARMRRAGVQPVCVVGGSVDSDGALAASPGIDHVLAEPGTRPPSRPFGSWRAPQ